MKHSNDPSGLKRSLATARAEIERLKAENERLGRELNLAKYGEPDFSWSIHKEAMSELMARAEKAEAERDKMREVSHD